MECFLCQSFKLYTVVLTSKHWDPCWPRALGQSWRGGGGRAISLNLELWDPPWMLLIRNTVPINKAVTKDSEAHRGLDSREASWNLPSSTRLPLLLVFAFLSLCPWNLTFFFLFILSREDQPHFFQKSSCGLGKWSRQLSTRVETVQT